MGKGPTKQANKKDMIKENFEQQKKSTPKIMKKTPSMDNAQWEERLFQVNGNQMKLKYKTLEENNAGTNEFEFEGDALKIDKWIQVEPSRLNGEVFSYDKEAQRELNYVSRGGWAEFKVPGTREQKAQMLTISIVMPEEGESEVFFMLNEPVELKFGEDFTVELEYGKYAKVPADSKGIMHFRDAKMYYKDELVKESAQVECDETGVRFDGKDTIHFEELPLVEEKQETDSKEQQDLSVNKSAGKDKITGADLFFDAKGAHLKTWNSFFININGEEVKLDYKLVNEEQVSTSQYRFDKKEWELQKGFKIYLKETGAVVTVKTDLFKKDKMVSFVSWRGVNATYQVPNLEEERKIGLEYITIQADSNKEVQIDFWFQQGDPLMVPLSEHENSFFLLLKNGKFEGKGQGIRFLNSEIFYRGKVYTNVEELISDENGLHLPDGTKFELDKALLDKDVLSEDEWNDYNDADADMKLALKFDKEKIQIDVQKNTIYRTLDQFGKIKNVKQEEGNKETGDLYLSDFPLILVIGKWNKRRKKTLKAKEEAIEGVTITEVKENGKIFNAKREEPISITYDVIDVELETGSGTSTFKKTITLENLQIKDGKLVVEKVTIENGMGREQESEEEAKEIFNCTVSGSVVQSSEWAEFTQEGLLMEEGKPTLGKLAIEDFLGFLSGEVDYPAGSLHVSASAGKETKTPPILEMGGETLGDGLKIPIPGTAGILKAKFSLTPSASIGGTIDVNANRFKSFGEKWQPGDKLSLGGEITVKGDAGISASAGVEAGFSYLANIDLMLTASLLANLTAGLGIYTKLVYMENENKKKHLGQADNLKFNGGIEAALKGEVTLGSNVKFLFWKKNLFELELYNETLGEVKAFIEAEKDKDSKGITKGWMLVNKEKFAKGLTKSVNLGFKNKEQKKQELDKKRQAILKDAKRKAEEAWSALMELEKGGEDCAIILSEAQKNELQPQIEEMKQKVKEKIEAYLKVLEKEPERLQSILNNLTKSLIMDKAELARLKKIGFNEFREKAILGGFSKENYGEDMSQEMMAVDFMIARTLGEVSEKNLSKIKSDRKAQDSVNRGISTWEEEFHGATFFGNQDSAESYRQYTSYYRMLNAETITYQREPGDVPKPYKAVIENFPQITNKELLQIALKGKYTDADEKENVIAATAEDKKDLFVFCFKLPKSNKGDLLGAKGKSRAKKSWGESMNAELRAQTGDETITLKSAANKISEQNLYRLTETIEKQIEDANHKIDNTTKRQVEVTEQLKAIPGIIAEYEKKLESINTNAESALTNKKFNADKAKTALNIYSEEYLGKIKGASETLEEKGKELQQARQMLEREKDQMVSLDNITLPPLLNV